MEKHSVDTAEDGDIAMDFIARFQYDLLIVDWNMPNRDGVTVCQDYRRAGGCAPILMLTGNQEVEQKETGLDAGADDYLTKPAHPKEFGARVRALLRRPKEVRSSSITVRGITLNHDTRQVFKGEIPISLHPKEFALLEFLMNHVGHVFSSEELVDRVWSSEADVMPSTVRCCMNRIRSQVDDEKSPSLIRTIYGTGYTIDRDSG